MIRWIVARRSLRWAFLLVASIGIVACGSDAREDAAADRDAADPAVAGRGTARAPADRSVFVDADWLSGAAAGATVDVLHSGGRASYDSAHIAGAHFFDVARLAEERDGVPGFLPSPAHLAALFDSAGVHGGRTVVAYGAPLAAARTFVALEHAGYTDAALLDGGFAGWRRAGFDVAAGGDTPVATPATNGGDAPVASPAGGATSGGGSMPYRGDAAGAGRVVAWDWVHERLEDPAVVLIDARPAAQYRGDEAGDRVPRPGHIPGAANLFWEELTQPDQPGTLRPEAELRARFEAAGVTPERVVIVYCRTGMQASYAYAVARQLGYDAYIYDGSFVEWSNRAELPVAR